MLTLSSSVRASADVPPNLSTISAAVIPAILAENGNYVKGSFAPFVNATVCALRQTSRVLGSKEILAELERRGVKKIDIADALDVDPSRVTELYAVVTGRGKPRHLKHDEAVKLVEEFGLEQARPEPLPQLPAAIWRLVAHHIASTLQLPLHEDNPKLQGLTADLAAFSRFLRGRQAQDILTAAEDFFRAMQYRSEAETEAPQETDPQPTL